MEYPYQRLECLVYVCTVRSTLKVIVIASSERVVLLAVAVTCAGKAAVLIVIIILPKLTVERWERSHHIHTHAFPGPNGALYLEPPTVPS